MSSALSYYMNKDSFPLSKRVGVKDVKSIPLEDLPGLQGRNVNWCSGINTIDHETGLAPLMVAAIQGKRDIAVALMDRGAEVDLRDEKKNRTALHFAAKTGHADVLKELLKRAAAPNAIDNYKKTAMMHAAKGGYLDCILLLLQRGASFNMVDENGFSAMHYAAKFGHHLVVSALIRATAAVEFRDELEGFTALHYAAQYGRKETVKVLLEEGFAKINRRSTKEKLTALMLAAREGNKSIVSMLITKGADSNLIDINGWTALHYACSWNRRDSAHILLVEGYANVNARDLNKDGVGGASPLIVAAKGGHIELIKLLLQYGADINLPEISTGNNPLAAASALGMRDSVQTLIDYHCDINYQNPLTYTTALMMAAMYGKRGPLICLFNAFADINILDRKALSAFDYANMITMPSSTNEDSKEMQEKEQKTTGERSNSSSNKGANRDIFLSAILHCSPYAKVNLLPWLEMECPKLIRGSSYGGPSVFLNSLLYTDKGLYYGLYKLTGDFDVYLLYAFTMIASICRQSITYQRDLLSNTKETTSLLEKEREVVTMLQRLLATSKGLCDDFVFTDCFLLGALPCKTYFSNPAYPVLGEYDDKYFMSAFWSGPLALCIENELADVLDQDQLRDQIDSCFMCCQRERGVEVDGYGYMSYFSRWRYCAAFMFVFEGIGQVMYLGCVTYYLFYLCESSLLSHTARERKWELLGASYDPRYSFTGYEAMLGLFSLSLLTYQLGLIEEKRWSLSPSIVFHFKDLERKRMRECYLHFFNDPYRFLDLLALLLSMSWLCLRVGLLWSSDVNRNPVVLTLSTQLLALSLIPVTWGLVRYPGAFSRSFGIEMLTIFLCISSLSPYLFFFLSLGLGFGLVYESIFSLSLAEEFGTIGRTTQTMFHAVLKNYDETLFSSTSPSSLSPSLSLSSYDSNTGVSLSFFFLVLAVVIGFNGIIGKLSSSYERNSVKATKWWALMKCLTVRTHSLTLEKSPLAMLPAPFSLVGLLVYIPHAYYTFRGRVSLDARTCLSIGGNVSDYFLAILLLMPSALYEYYRQHVWEARDLGFMIRLFQATAWAPLGVSYAALCLLWKLTVDPPMRVIVKSRLTDGRLRLSYSVKRDKWELHMLSRFEDERVFKELEKYGGERGGDVGGGGGERGREKSVFEDVDDLHRKRRKVTLSDSLGGGEREKKEREDGEREGESKEGEGEGEREYESDEDENMFVSASGHKKLLLWQKMVRALSPFTRRDLDYLGTRRVRIAPVQTFLQLAQVPPNLTAEVSGREGEARKPPGAIDQVAKAFPSMDARQLRTYSTAQVFDPRYIKRNLGTGGGGGPVVLTAKDIHSEERESLLPGVEGEREREEEERARERAKMLSEPPQLVWKDNNTSSLSLNPYQPGILYNEQWNELSREREPVDSLLVSTYNYEGEREKENSLSLLSLDNEPNRLPTTPFSRKHPVAGERDEDKRERLIEREEGERVGGRERRKGQRDEVDGSDETLYEAQQKLQGYSKSLYFHQQCFPSILTPLERKRIFEVVLPEIFIDDFAHAVESNRDSIQEMEIRLKHQEQLQVKNMSMMFKVMEKLDGMNQTMMMQMQMMMMQQQGQGQGQNPQQQSYASYPGQGQSQEDHGMPRFGDTFPSSMYDMSSS